MTGRMAARAVISSREKTATASGESPRKKAVSPARSTGAVKKTTARGTTARKKIVSQRGRPKKTVKYTKTVNVRLTQHQWAQVITWSGKAHLEPSVYIRKVLLDFLNITSEDR